MDNERLEASVDLYKSQLNHVEQAINAAGETEDLVKLREDLTELISLTEDSLLSLKKSQLLDSLNSGDQSTSRTVNSIDDEYAAFQAALSNDITYSTIDGSTEKTIEAKTTNELQPSTTSEKLEESLADLEGMRCRAPFQHDWGCLVYCNALILSVDPISDDTHSPRVNVMFCNPSHSSMAPCPFYLEGRCKYSDEECRNSHGYSVMVEDLKEFKEPDYSLLKIEGKCLGQYEEDSLWYKATVIDMLDNHEIQVLFDEYGDKAVLKLEQILPLESEDDDDSESDDESNQPLDKSDSEEDDALPVFLWKPPQTTVQLGEWEKHTRGIGSKLMSKMGYIVGQGLGKNGDGKAEPVPIQLIPKGKSLDKIMELKEIAGDQDLFDVMKKSKKKKAKSVQEKHVKISSSQTSTDVFDFINKKLRGKKGNLHDLILKHPGGPGTSENKQNKKHITEKELHSKSDRHLNIQLLKTDEELRNVEKELRNLKVSLARNEQRDKAAATRISAKIATLEDYKRKLKTSEQTISSHKQRRNDHKKLTIF